MTRSATSRATPAKRKATSRKQTAAKRTAGSAETEPGGETAVDIQELHRRWANARQVVGEAVGREEQHDPRIWERGVYQLWLWLVVERLVVGRDEIETNELATISKMLHEQRKLSLEEAKQRQKGDDHDHAAASATGLPAQFGEIVRQIYGTNFQDDATLPDAAAECVGQCTSDE